MTKLCAVAACGLALAAALLLGDPASGGSASTDFIVTGYIGATGSQCRARPERGAVECTRGTRGLQGPFLAAGLPGSAAAVATGQQQGATLVRYGQNAAYVAEMFAMSTTSRTVYYNGLEYVETTVSW